MIATTQNYYEMLGDIQSTVALLQRCPTRSGGGSDPNHRGSHICIHFPRRHVAMSDIYSK